MPSPRRVDEKEHAHGRHGGIDMSMVPSDYSFADHGLLLVKKRGSAIAH